MHSPLSRVLFLMVALACVAARAPAADDDDLPAGAIARLGAPDKKPNDQFNAVPSIDFSPDGKIVGWVSNSFLPTAPYWTFVIPLYDVASGKELRRLNFGDEHGGCATTPLRFSADGTQVAVAVSYSTGGPIKSSTRSNEQLRLWDVKTGRVSTPFPVFTQRGTQPYQSLGISPDGKTLFATRELQLQRWNARSGELIRQRPIADLTSGAYVCQLISQDGKWMAVSQVQTAANATRGPFDGPVTFWDLAEGSSRELKAQGFVAGISGDGKRLAVRTLAKKLLVWDIDKDKQMAAFDADVLSWSSQAVDFSSNGRLLAWTDHQKKACVADLISGKVLATLGVPAQTVTFSPDGKLLASIDADNTLLLWDVVRMTRRRAR